MSTPSISVKAVTERLTRTTRMLRKPKHTWQVRHQPFVIQPICIAPVLTGETLVDGVYQARAVSDPVNNPLIGWWVEYYWFYVKLRDLASRDVVTEIMLDPSATLTSLHSPAKVSTYHTANTIDWVELCRQVVTQEYFREEGEAWNVAAGMLNGDPMMKAVPANSSWLDSAMRDADTGSVDDLQHPYDDPVLAQYQAAYDRMRKMQMIDMTFDEWLGTFGVSVRQDEQQHIPELLRYYRSWTYPANTVDAATGAPTSAMSWAVADTLRKDRFFREPGFICGYSVARPKFYLGNQTMAAVNMLDDAAAWLPPALREQGWSSIRKIASTASGPISGQGASPANDYWVDLRDLWLYGDQFVNYALDDASSRLALPAASLQKQYATDAMLQTLFKTPASAKLVRQDGVINFDIKAHAATATDLT